MDIPETGAVRVPDPASSDDLNSASHRALVAAAMAQLSVEHRTVVRLAYHFGWTTAQIGADLGIADGTVKSRLHYALRSLRQTLREMGVAR